LGDVVESKNRLTRGQIIFVVVVVLINVVLWIIPSDVVELVARDRQTLLGRYSRRHFTWILAVLVVSIILIRLHLSPSKAVKKKRIFHVLAVLIALVPTLFVADVALRLTKHWRYVLGDLAYHRPPGSVWHDVFEDKPKAIRTYPNAPPGYPTVRSTMTIDGRGFRNLDAPDHVRVVVLGDSFAEGSHVSDGQTWPRLFAQKSGASTYNLGMSGYAPQHYRAALKQYGVGLRPEFVFCMIYEGNDFKSAKVTVKAPSEWMRFFKRSPIIDALDNLLIRTLGPIGAHRRVAGMDALSWMPVAYPPGADARYYAFPPVHVVRYYVTRSEFQADKHWKRTVVNLDAIRKLCKEAGARLVILYAPSKPHVVMPPLRDTLPAEKVRAFVAMKADETLPPAEEFMRRLMEGFEVKESLTRQWCERNGAAFFSLTRPLRAAAGHGRQVYYTYNEHWSPVGHEVVADAIAAYWPELTRAAAGDKGS